MTDQPTPQPPSETRSVLFRILILFGILIGFFIYAYGWTVTEIDLERPQEAQRQENVTIALRELLSPRILQQERDVIILSAPFLMECGSGEAPEAPTPSGDTAVVILEPTCADDGDVITVQVVNGESNADARIRWMPPGAEDDEDVRPRPREILETGREELVLNGNGGFTGTIEVPRIRGGAGEIHDVQVQIAIPAGPILLSETALLVIDRMAQTIFMALVATTIAIPIAAVISFFAARNLMQPIRSSVGSLLLAFITFAFGMAFGGRLLGPLGRLGLDIGRGAVGGGAGALLAFGIPIVVVVLTVILLRQINPPQTTAKGETPLPRRILSSIIVMVVGVFSLGALGGLGLLGAEQISTLAESIRPAEDSAAGWVANLPAVLIDAVANLLMILGSIIELGITLIASVLFAFTLVSIAGSLFGPSLRRLDPLTGRVAGGILGVISGAILMGFMATFGTWASLLGILPVLVAGLLGGIALRLILSQLVPVPAIQTLLHRRVPRLILFFVGAVPVALWAFDLLNVGRSLVDGTLPPQTLTVFAGMTLPLPQYVFNAAIVGMVLCGLSGALAGTRATFPFGGTLYNVSRTSLNVVRSIEPLIMGLVFVVWVGIGPFAGVLALTLHSIAALGKLYSEQIENIDQGPIEALQSTGASQLQTIIYAVVPQIIPPYIAFTMYRWDINVRMSTIIGFVGGGGIGLLLQQQINLLRYRDAGVAVLAIAIVVSILDYASASIRERVT
jgi:phosphonate ABC transporter permease subunit PhnE